MLKGSGCLNCPAKTACTATYRSSRCAAARQQAGADFDPITQGDRFRSLNDTELAHELSVQFCHGFGEQEILRFLTSYVHNE